MTSVCLERVRREVNELQFYDLNIQQDMFGKWVLESSWGRIGTDGNRRLTSFETGQEAILALQGYCAAKVRCGFQIVYDPLNLGNVTTDDRLRGPDKMVSAADELEMLLSQIPDGPSSKFGKIVSELASACRHRRLHRTMASGGRAPELPAILRDDVDYRVRARVFQLIGHMVSATLNDFDVAAISFVIRDGSNDVANGEVIRMVPKSLWAYLDRGVSNFFSDDRSLEYSIIKLNRAGIRLIGQLVQVPFSELLLYLEGDRQLLQRIEEKLTQIGLRLHSRAPGWEPCDRSAAR